VDTPRVAGRGRQAMHEQFSEPARRGEAGRGFTPFPVPGPVGPRGSPAVLAYGLEAFGRRPETVDPALCELSHDRTRG
jgi:hypothetical protein